MTTDQAGDRVGPDDRSSSGPRDVVVPKRVYKAVTVFSTTFAVIAVVVGFVLVDGATDRARAPLDEVEPWLALAGLGAILLGAVVYAFSTRFRTEEMGNPKDDAAEGSDNG